mmetsp:Transcript_6702/g.14282  ORF Transcript_6702/g.14282 Transcript_6702/m.14282 type:complete len:414 (-) Transcript_6702:314-1555(-)
MEKRNHDELLTRRYRPLIRMQQLINPIPVMNGFEVFVLPFFFQRQLLMTANTPLDGELQCPSAIHVDVLLFLVINGEYLLVGIGRHSKLLSFEGRIPDPHQVLDHLRSHVRVRHQRRRRLNLIQLIQGRAMVLPFQMHHGQSKGVDFGIFRTLERGTHRRCDVVGTRVEQIPVDDSVEGGVDRVYEIVGEFPYPLVDFVRHLTEVSEPGKRGGCGFRGGDCIRRDRSGGGGGHSDSDSDSGSHGSCCAGCPCCANAAHPSPPFGIVPTPRQRMHARQPPQLLPATQSLLPQLVLHPLQHLQQLLLGVLLVHPLQQPLGLLVMIQGQALVHHGRVGVVAIPEFFAHRRDAEDGLIVVEGGFVSGQLDVAVEGVLEVFLGLVVVARFEVDEADVVAGFGVLAEAFHVGYVAIAAG